MWTHLERIVNKCWQTIMPIAIQPQYLNRAESQGEVQRQQNKLEAHVYYRTTGRQSMRKVERAGRKAPPNLSSAALCYLIHAVSPKSACDNTSRMQIPSTMILQVSLSTLPPCLCLVLLFSPSPFLILCRPLLFGCGGRW